MTGVVVKHTAIEAGAEVFDLHLMDEKLRQLKSPVENIRPFSDEFAGKDTHHRGAGTGRNDDGIHVGLLETAHGRLEHRSRLVVVAAVEGGLAAAGLIGWNDDVEAGLSKHTDSVEADTRIELIDKAGNEEADSLNHAGSVAE